MPEGGVSLFFSLSFLTVTVGSNEVRHSLFPLGSRCIPVRSAQTISAHPRKYTLCVWAMWEPSFLFWTADREEVGAPGFKPQQAWLWLDPHYYLMAETSNRGGKELHTTFSHKYTLKAAFNVGKHNFLVNHMTAHCTDCVTKQQGWGFFLFFFWIWFTCIFKYKIGSKLLCFKLFYKTKTKTTSALQKIFGIPTYSTTRWHQSTKHSGFNFVHGSMGEMTLCNVKGIAY